MKIDARRTPDERFENLQGFSFAPHYVDDLPGSEGLRLHFLDEGPRDATHTFLCLHGEPTWCYLYRKMIPVFTAASHRVVAPDFFGFGRSDKPTDDASYSFGFHRDALLRFVDRLELRDVTLVCQDWGGLLGLTLPLDRPELIARLVVMNTAIADGSPPGPGFQAWKEHAAAHPDLDVGKLMARTVPGLSDAERSAYEAPFPDVHFKAGVRRFPEIVPVAPEMEGADLGRRAARWWRDEWSGPSFMAIGPEDRVLGPPVMKRLHAVIRGCPEPFVVEGAGHFVQERGEEVAQRALAAFG